MNYNNIMKDVYFSLVDETYTLNRILAVQRILLENDACMKDALREEMHDKLRSAAYAAERAISKLSRVYDALEADVEVARCHTLKG